MRRMRCKALSHTGGVQGYTFETLARSTPTSVARIAIRNIRRYPSCLLDAKNTSRISRHGAFLRYLAWCSMRHAF